MGTAGAVALLPVLLAKRFLNWSAMLSAPGTPAISRSTHPERRLV
ncbi:hypothetical protein [Flavobacterium sp. HJJ]|nr:hypothetical protein [Flavobacterium sp. HJJ]